MSNKDVNMGGQAVIEGVMMRSEKYISVAVRKPDGTIAIKKEENLPWGKLIKITPVPFCSWWNCAHRSTHSWDKSPFMVCRCSCRE